MPDRRILGPVLVLVAVLALVSCHRGTTADEPTTALDRAVAAKAWPTDKLTRAENVAIHILASAQTTGELEPCG